MDLNRKGMLKAYPAMPQETKNQMAYTLNTLHAQARPAPRRYARRLSFAGLLAATLMMTVIAVAVGTHLGVFDFMGRSFGGSGVLPDAKELVQTNLGGLDLNNTILIAQEAVYDGGNLRVVYSVQAKALSKPLTQADMDDPKSEFRRALASDGLNPDGSCDWFLINGTEYSMTNGSTGDAVLDAENGKLFCYLDIQLASDGIIPQGDFTVQLPLAGEVNARKTLDFTVQANPSPQQKATIQTEHATITLKSSFLSPVRAYASIRIEMKEGSSFAQADAVFEQWRDAALTDAQGKKLGALEELLPSNLEDGKSVDYSYTFLPVDAKEVYLAPIIINTENEWAGDMDQALRMK